MRNSTKVDGTKLYLAFYTQKKQYIGIYDLYDEYETLYILLTIGTVSKYVIITISALIAHGR